MTRVAAAVVLAALMLVLPPTPSARADPPTITPICTPAPSNCTGWYTAPSVTVTWTVSNASTIGGCSGGTVSTDTTGTTFTCSASNDDGTTTRTVTVRRDATPPSVNRMTPDRSADANAWYSRPFSVTFDGSDATSGIASCTTVGYGGPDTAGGSLTGTCTDVAGNTSAPASFAFRYDATPPEVARVVFSRSPDSGDWYTKPVGISFAGADATSGIESCTGVEYAGPDGPATVVGSCRDRAGNVSGERTAALNYDATPPQLAEVSVERDRTVVMLRWQASADAVAVEVERAPGAKGSARTTLYRGTDSSFRDKGLARNRRYQYVVTARDQAGNRASRQASVFVRPALYRPAAGARVRARPLLVWEADPKARYYNVQLFRGREKILTLWPAKPHLRLPRAWRFGGERQRLVPGRYRWYVWPGYGPRARSNYGKLIGKSAFVVTG